MTSKSEPIDVLETILKRNSEPDEEIDLRGSEVDRWFYFDKIADPDDLEAAWAVFPASAEIRKRLQQVEEASNVMEGWGYRVAKEDNCCAPAELVEILRTHLARMRPLIPDEEYYQEVAGFLDGACDVRIAPPGIAAPDEDEENALFDALYEAISEFKLEHISLDEPHQQVLYDWAIYLTKCDEVATYLLWPCLRNVDHLPADTAQAGFELWKYNCRKRYWIKGADFDSGMVYISPPCGA